MWWNENSWPKRVPCLATIIEYIYLVKFHYCTHRILQRPAYTHIHPVSVGLNGEAVFTFIDFIALSVHLSFQDVTLNQALHNFLWRREQRWPLNKKRRCNTEWCSDLEYWSSAIRGIVWQPAVLKQADSESCNNSCSRQSSHQETSQSLSKQKCRFACPVLRERQKKICKYKPSWAVKVSLWTKEQHLMSAQCDISLSQSVGFRSV